MGVPWVPTLYMIMTSVFPTHKFDIASQAETSLGLAQTLISVYRAWMCVFLGLLLVALRRYRPLPPYRLQHQDIAISDELVRRATRTRDLTSWTPIASRLFELPWSTLDGGRTSYSLQNFVGVVC